LSTENYIELNGNYEEERIWRVANYEAP